MSTPTNPNDPTHPSPFDTGDVMPRHVGLFCDDFDNDCENEISGDFLVASRDEAFAALRRYATEQGWQISPKADYCPEHATPAASVPSATNTEEKPCT